jgi:hypothetical protein
MRKWEDKIRTDIKEISISTMNWLGSIQNWDYWRILVNTALNLRIL